MFLPHSSKRNHFGIKSCSYQPQKLTFMLNTSKPFSNVELFSIFRQSFFGNSFPDQNKYIAIGTTTFLVDQLSKKYCVYYVSENLKYCTQIKEYWLNKKSVCQKCVFLSNKLHDTQVISFASQLARIYSDDLSWSLQNLHIGFEIVPKCSLSLQCLVKMLVTNFSLLSESLHIVITTKNANCLSLFLSLLHTYIIGYYNP